MKRILLTWLPSFLLVLSLAVPRPAKAQQISYAEPEHDDSRRTNFEIIGKVGGNYLVFKNNNSENNICVYDDNMKLLKRTVVDMLGEKYINVDFVTYPDHFYLIFEHQRRNIVHCTALNIDAMGERIGEPIELDTTQIGFAASNKIYTTVVSENRQRIMVFKINSHNPKNFLFTTFLYDDSLHLIDRHRLYLPVEERNELFSDFLLDNAGEMVFAKFLRSGSNDYITRVSLVTKAPVADSFLVRDVGAGDRILDEIKIKVDNNNRRYILTGFYYKLKRGNIEGLYSVVWDKETDTRNRENATAFSDELRSMAKSQDASLRLAFNDYFIKNIITKKDGGFLVISESQYTTSRGNMFNRWDYMSSPYSPGMYYSPYYSPYYGTWNRNYGNYANRFHAENIMVLSFDATGKLEWNSIVPKSQFDDETENLISFQLMNTGGELHFLFNQYDHRNMLLNDQSIAPDGKVTRYPTLHNLDRGYDFMPRYGKQISSWQTIIPCMYRNYLCFAKIDF
jgi:hypothetical protein